MAEETIRSTDKPKFVWGVEAICLKEEVKIAGKTFKRGQRVPYMQLSLSRQAVDRMFRSGFLEAIVPKKSRRGADYPKPDTTKPKQEKVDALPAQTATVKRTRNAPVPSA